MMTPPGSCTMANRWPTRSNCTAPAKSEGCAVSDVAGQQGALMFDVGFSEIVVIMVVALVVIGPKRLPAVARSMGQWWGRLQRYINRMKMDVTASMELEDLRELERKVKAEAEALERSVQQAGNDLDHEMRQLEKKLEHSTRDLRKADPHVVPTLSIKQP